MDLLDDLWNQVTFFQDDKSATYRCDGRVCGYNGDEYCQNCGSDKDGD